MSICLYSLFQERTDNWLVDINIQPPGHLIVASYIYCKTYFATYKHHLKFYKNHLHQRRGLHIKCYLVNHDDYDDDDDDENYGIGDDDDDRWKENENGKLENVEHSVFHFNLQAICSLSKYSELPKKDSHLKYNLGGNLFLCRKDV